MRTACLSLSLVFAFVLAFVGGASSKEEAVYKGKKVDAWIADLTDKSAAVRRTACQSLLRLGKDAESAVQPLILILKNDKEELPVKIAAAEALGEIGPKAKDALPFLAEAMHHGDNKYSSVASFSMSRIGAKEAAPYIVKMLNQAETPAVRSRAARALGILGPEAKEAIPALSRGLMFKEPEYLLSAAFALKKMAADAKDGVPGYLPLLHDGSVEVQILACKSLGLIGVHAKDALPALTALLRTGNGLAKAAAAEAMLNIDPKGQAELVAKVLKQLLEDTDANVRSAASKVVSGASKEAKEALTAADPTLGEAAKAAAPTKKKAR